MMGKQNYIPQNWAISSLQEVAVINPTLDKSAFDDVLEVSFVPMPAVEAETGRIDVSQTKKFGEVKKGYTPFQRGDVLFAKITPCMENGKMAVVPDLHNGIGFGSTEFHVLRAYEGVEPKFLYYFVSSKSFRYDAEHNMTGAVGQKRVPTTYIEKSIFTLPPTNEQKRIVAKIDELFSELDSGIRSLKTAREQLDVYRQVILKYAFEGKLTSVWRDKNKDRLETADQLLERIKKERRAKWEADLREKGKDTAKVKYVEPKAQEVKGLPELPKGWVWISLEMMASTNKHSISSGPFGSALGTKDYISNGIPVIRGQNISNGAFLASEFVFISEAKAAQLIRSFTYPDDLIVVAVGSSGKAAILPSFVERGILSQNCNKITLDKSLVLPKFVELAMQTDIALNQLKNKTTDTVRQFLSLTNLKQTVIPLLPLTEQEQIVAEVERRFSIIAELEGLIEASLKRAEKLRQSILREAFAGRLVSQDPNDEPASVLLERIRFEKTTTQTNNKSNHQHKVKSINEYTQSSLIQETAV